MIFGRKPRRHRGPAALPVPPFPPDPPAPQLDSAPALDALDAVLAQQGVALPGPAALLPRQAGLPPLWSVAVEPGYPAAALWKSVRDVHERTWLWPVLTTGLDWLSEAWSPTTPVVGSGVSWFVDRATGVLEEVPCGVSSKIEPNDPEFYDWADALASSGDHLDRLLLVPAASPWLVPGLLGWAGACNQDIDGNAHATVLHRWANYWQAELVALEQRDLTLRVLAPPTDDKQAMAAAVEVAIYCSSIVFQGHDTLEDLASALCLPLWPLRWN